MENLLINGNTRLYGIIGNPVSHSFSPDMHTRAFKELKINSVYLPFPVQKLDLPNLLTAFQLINLQGFNVTVPYKEEIIHYLPEVSEEAEFIGAVNTVIKTKDSWKGYCTDGSGFIRALKNRQIELKNSKVLLLGAGGAAKAIAFSLLKTSIAKLDIQNRTKEKADELRSNLSKVNHSIDISVNSSELTNYDLLINTTSVGMKDNGIPLPEEQIAKCKQVVDIIYNPPLTPLLHIAKSLEIPYHNGIDMLLYQGVEAFELWTQRPAPVNIMRESLKNSLAFIK
ncbi:MAG: shikimate dehydrogenase [Proteobacteria bacterium]|nr:shikimate dehydrogenase [Pseudomonadota bacterium]